MYEIEGGVPVTINKKQYTLVHTYAATKAVASRYGGVRQMVLKVSGPADEEGDAPETLAEKAKAREKARIDSLDEIPWLIALHANQGIMLETGNTDPKNPDLLTPEKVGLILPKYAGPLTESVMEAIRQGMGVEHQPGEDEEEDVVLTELDLKNATGAAE